MYFRTTNDTTNTIHTKEISSRVKSIALLPIDEYMYVEMVLLLETSNCRRLQVGMSAVVVE